jgi:hypothetical protein
VPHPRHGLIMAAWGVVCATKSTGKSFGQQINRE